ncbi:cation:proton antiporter [Rhizobium sp. BK376]|uniref:cation:proton antiporter n=1 Tax=Rhizobium sp. BK376 TaxID=2512149 RepID=UPI001045563E|nr:cation:proton antiporter [Rhizobium sp. BK376]TCR82475.1 sodium/proton antiporter (CPA1 family) [Rhizobium sp. BK376]
MAFFESLLTLLAVAVIVLQPSRRLVIPYPTMLAVAGVLVAALPWAPAISIDPQLALALFISPALFDAAYDLPPRTLRQNWLPLISLAAIAVILTTLAVAWLGVAFAGLPVAAAIALGAIVAPPDAAAATAMLSRFSLPRRAFAVLKGESLLNDAVALLIFSAAVSTASGIVPLTELAPRLALAVPGGLLLGFLLGKLYLFLATRLAGTLGGSLFEFVATFGTWVIAERLHLSAVLAIVVYAMVIARYMPERQTARNRIHSYSVWEATIFMLNVLAFLLMGMQARATIMQLYQHDLAFASLFAASVFLVVVGVRMLWVLFYNRVLHYLAKAGIVSERSPSMAMTILAGWCGMRGVVTLATAIALPASFPSRDLIVFSALAVVLGTLILQGLTLGPLIHLLKFKSDDSLRDEIAATRLALLDTALDELDKSEQTDEVRTLREIYRGERKLTSSGIHPREASEFDKLRRKTIRAKRVKLAELRRSGAIDDDVFHALERELDWAELAAATPDQFEIIEG